MCVRYEPLCQSSRVGFHGNLTDRRGLGSNTQRVMVRRHRLLVYEVEEAHLPFYCSRIKKEQNNIRVATTVLLADLPLRLTGKVTMLTTPWVSDASQHFGGSNLLLYSLASSSSSSSSS